MKLHVYEGERFHRPIWWRVIAGCVVLGLLGGTIRSRDRRGVAILLIVFIAYAGYEWHTYHDLYLIDMDAEGLTIGKKRLFRHDIQGFSLGFFPESEIISSLFLYTSNDVFTYTPDDSQEEILDFVQELEQRVQYIKQLKLSSSKRFMRWLRL